MSAVYPEGFQGVTPPALPSGWVGSFSGWTSTNVGGHAGSSQSLKMSNFSTAAAGSCGQTATDAFGGDNYVVGTAMYSLGSAGPIMGTFDRGSGGTMGAAWPGTYSCCGLQVAPGTGGHIDLISIASGTQTTLASISVVIPAGVWCTYSRKYVGKHLSVEIFREDTLQYLTSAGSWSGTQQYCFDNTYSAIPGAGAAQNGVFGYAGSADTAFMDDFTMASTGTVPTAPTGCSSTAGNTTASVIFTAGTATTTGATISGVNIYANGVLQTGSPFTSSPATISGLTNGTSYAITCKTLDSNGLESTATSAGSVTPVAGISVALDQANQTTNQGASVTVNATVTGGTPTTVTWSGTALAQSVAGTSGNQRVFTAGSAPGTYTLTATSVADTSKTASVIFTIPAITVSVTPSSVTLAPSGTQTFSATVSGTTNTAVTWTASSGTINSSTGAYVAPSSTGSATITATSVADSSKAGTASVTISSVTNYQTVADFGSSYTGLTGTIGFLVQTFSAGVFTTIQARTTSGIAEQGTSGGYNATFPGSPGTTYSVLWDTGGTTPAYLRDVFTTPSSSGGGLSGTDIVPTTGNTVNSVFDCLNAARAQGFGKWAIIGTTLNLYAPNGVTIVRSFTLDNLTNPLSRT